MLYFSANYNISLKKRFLQKKDTLALPEGTKKGAFLEKFRVVEGKDRHWENKRARDNGLSVFLLPAGAGCDICPAGKGYPRAGRE